MVNFDLDDDDENMNANRSKAKIKTEDDNDDYFGIFKEKRNDKKNCQVCGESVFTKNITRHFKVYHKTTCYRCLEVFETEVELEAHDQECPKERERTTNPYIGQCGSIRIGCWKHNNF